MRALPAPRVVWGLGMAAVLWLGVDRPLRPPRPPTARYYASPAGSPSGDGSRDRP